MLDRFSAVVNVAVSLIQSGQYDPRTDKDVLIQDAIAIVLSIQTKINSTKDWSVVPSILSPGVSGVPVTVDNTEKRDI